MNCTTEKIQKYKYGKRFQIYKTEKMNGDYLKRAIARGRLFRFSASAMSVLCEDYMLGCKPKMNRHYSMYSLKDLNIRQGSVLL